MICSMFGEPMHLDTPNKYACILKQKSCLCRRGGTLLKIRELFVLNAKLLKQKEKKKISVKRLKRNHVSIHSSRMAKAAKLGERRNPLWSWMWACYHCFSGGREAGRRIMLANWSLQCSHIQALHFNYKLVTAQCLTLCLPISSVSTYIGIFLFIILYYA